MAGHDLMSTTLLASFERSSFITAWMESTRTDFETSTIIRTVGRVVWRHCGCGGRIVTGTLNFKTLRKLNFPKSWNRTYRSHIKTPVKRANQIQTGGKNKGNWIAGIDAPLFHQQIADSFGLFVQLRARQHFGHRSFAVQQREQHVVRCALGSPSQNFRYHLLLQKKPIVNFLRGFDDADGGTFLEESLSSSTKPPTSRPWALASRFPCTKLPTITLAGPTSETQSLAETHRRTQRHSKQKLLL